MPMFAVFGAVAKDLLLLLSMGISGLGVRGMATEILVWLAAFASWVEWTGFIGSAMLCPLSWKPWASPWRPCESKAHS